MEYVGNEDSNASPEAKKMKEEQLFTLMQQFARRFKTRQLLPKKSVFFRTIGQLPDTAASTMTSKRNFMPQPKTVWSISKPAPNISNTDLKIAYQSYDRELSFRISFICLLYDADSFA